MKRLKTILQFVFWRGATAPLAAPLATAMSPVHTTPPKDPVRRSDTPTTSQIPPEFVADKRCNRRHGLTYRQVQTNLLWCSFSFFPRAIRLWSNLPQEAVYT